MSQNRIVLYSNGIADFQRVVKVTGDRPTEVSIPVSKQHLADVLASLNIYGDVRFDSAPTFRPDTEFDGSITINPKDSFNTLASELSGSKVAIEKAGGTVEGLLLGTHETQIATTGSPCTKEYLVVSTNQGVKNIAYSDIVSLESKDDIVKAEIDKALKRNYETIKPNSTFVDFSIASISETDNAEDVSEAFLQYAVPVAAWKISYRLIRSGDNDFLLRGFAIVDNNTEEDWNNVMISVVTGEPITFSTDLAEAKTPRREHVNIVNETAIGAIELEPEMVMMAAPAESLMRGESGVARGRQVAAKKVSPRKLASIDVAETREVSDFSVYDAKLSVSIGSNQSAMIPILELNLGETKTVLHYDSSKHSNRPFRCIEFVNSSTQSLSRGPCNVVIDETYVGSCILPASKPTETSILPHVLETSVLVDGKHKSNQRKLVSLKVSEGVSIRTFRIERVHAYEISSVSKEARQFVLDHDSERPAGSITATLMRSDHEPIELHEVSKTKSGYRVRFELMANDRLSIRIVEKNLDSHRLAFGKDGFAHDFFGNLIEANSAIADDSSVIQCIELQAKIDGKTKDLEQQQSEIRRLNQRQERLRKNIGVGSNDEHSNQWRADLATAENRMVEIEETIIPKLEAQRRKIGSELFDAAKSLVFDWEEK